MAAPSPVGRNKPVRAAAKTGVSGKHHPISPETPPRATRLDGLIPAYAFPPKAPVLGAAYGMRLYDSSGGRKK